MKRSAAFILFITLAFSGSAFAIGSPDFSGTWTLNMASGKEIRSTCRWEGSTIVTKSVMSMEQGTAESTFVQSLSADGRVMTIDTTTKTPNGVRKKKLIYDKQ